MCATQRAVSRFIAEKVGRLGPDAESKCRALLATPDLVPGTGATSYCSLTLRFGVQWLQPYFAQMLLYNGVMLLEKLLVSLVLLIPFVQQVRSFLF